MAFRSSLRKTLVILAAQAVLFTSSALADTTIVDDNFDSYASDAALYAAWEPRNGSGSAAPNNPDDGILTSEILDPERYPGVQGQAVDHVGSADGFPGDSILQSTLLTPGAPIVPSATQSIRFGGDIFVGNDGNSRKSIALRNRTTVENLIELGTYNSNGQTSDPTDPNDSSGLVPVSTYAYRLRLFDAIGGDLVEEPDWQFFQFDPALDVIPTDGEADGIVGPLDIGAAWHTYSATITPDTIKLEVDLYRDGLDNGATLTAGSDVAGVDATVEWQISATAAGFDSLRIGGVSGLSSANSVAFDNVSLSLIDVGTGGGSDTDDDGDVDGSDFLELQRTDAAGIAQWQVDYGSPSGLSSSISAVPEPGSLALLLSTALGLLAHRRQR